MHDFRRDIQLNGNAVRNFTADPVSSVGVSDPGNPGQLRYDIAADAVFLRKSTSWKRLVTADSGVYAKGIKRAHSTTQTGGGSVVLSFDSIEYDSGDVFASSANQQVFEIQTPGKYLVKAGCQINSHLGSSSLALRKNGVIIAEDAKSTSEGLAAPSRNISNLVSTVIYLDAGDQISVLHTSNLAATTLLADPHTFLIVESMETLAPEQETYSLNGAAEYSFQGVYADVNVNVGGPVGSSGHGKIVYKTTGSGWGFAESYQNFGSGTNLLGLTMGNRILLFQGMFKFNPAVQTWLNVTPGVPLYLDVNGEPSVNPPTNQARVKRFIGSNLGNNVFYFNPDSSFTIL